MQVSRGKKLLILSSDKFIYFLFSVISKNKDNYSYINLNKKNILMQKILRILR